ncbi:hypothetical protein GCM10009639_20770 [Kitasatospora putterlickiae]|uniref:Uncharacterized protein n=1 Tax=Kitasatospora putterlickiae TaxID=221725 RepID=A0ABN1XVE8_9ACTN
MPEPVSDHRGAHRQGLVGHVAEGLRFLRTRHRDGGAREEGPNLPPGRRGKDLDAGQGGGLVEAFALFGLAAGGKQTGSLISGPGIPGDSFEYGRFGA